MEDVLRLMFAYFWIWIPIVAILAGSFKEWLKHKEKLAQLGASTGSLEGDVTELRRERDALLQRIQNLEAIVINEVWEERQRLPAMDPGILEEEPSDSERAAVLARRIRG